MKLTSAFILGLSASASAGVAKRQSGPVEPGTDKDCTYYDESYSSSDDCQHFEDYWGVTHADFVAWNPSVKSDCSGIKVGNSYCVEVTRKPEPTSSTSTVTTPTPTKVAKPAPTQDGLIDTCTNFYFTVANDNCEKIAKKFGTFSVSEFISWNPAVGDDCSGIWAKTYYCVGIPGTPTAPVTTSAVAPTPTGSAKPSPTQEGLIESCTNFYFAVANDNCEKIAKKYSTFNVADFIKWNPAVSDDCSGIWAKTYYCVGVPGTPTTPPMSSTAPSTTTKPSPTGNGISTPLPTQPGMVDNCDAFFFVPSDGTEGCQSIADKSGISLSQFLAWNPEVGGNSCSGLWAKAYVCISVIGHTPSKPTTTTKPTPTPTPVPTGCQVSHPEPTQPGSVCGCKQWYKPAGGEYCWDIQQKFKISADNFNRWNPSVGSNCEGLWKDTYVCVRN